MKYLVIYFLTLTFSHASSSFASTWLIEEGTSLEDLYKIDSTPNLFVHQFIETNSTINAMALDLSREYELAGTSDALNTFIKEMQKVTLSETGRNLISQTLNSQKATKNSFVAQREQLFQGPANASDFLPGLENRSTTDLLYINGFLISKAEINKLSFKKESLYHLVLVSNKYEPLLIFTTGEDLKLPTQVPLYSGNCRDPKFSHFAVKEGLKVFFNDNCVADSRLANFDPKYLQTDENRNSEMSKRTKYIIWGVAGLAAGALAYNYFKTHEVTLELQF